MLRKTDQKLDKITLLLYGKEYSLQYSFIPTMVSNGTSGLHHTRSIKINNSHL
jgi:hypothetical protein